MSYSGRIFFGGTWGQVPRPSLERIIIFVNSPLLNNWNEEPIPKTHEIQ